MTVSICKAINFFLGFKSRNSYIQSFSCTTHHKGLNGVILSIRLQILDQTNRIATVVPTSIAILKQKQQKGRGRKVTGRVSAILEVTGKADVLMGERDEEEKQGRTEKRERN